MDSAGHLSLRFESEHPAEVPFLLEQRQKRIGPAFLASLGYHVLAAVALILVIKDSPTSGTTAAVLAEQPKANIVWLYEPGQGGGGGGGGNRMKEPPRKAEQVGNDAATVPVSKPPKLEPPQEAKVEPNPLAQLNIPAKSLAAAADSLPGVLQTPPGPPTVSQGPGTGGGAGPGAGPGIGSGRGPGLEDGFEGGTGGRGYHIGSGVNSPLVIREVKPQYTPDAMRARIQGSVIVECVVRRDGTVGDAHVVRSLDPSFGLDETALSAARQWRFQPGTRFGEPVPVIITIELTFSVR